MAKIVLSLFAINMPIEVWVINSHKASGSGTMAEQSPTLSEIKGQNLGTVENCCEKKDVTRFIDEKL